ncbi:hypothetical protein BpHYR1_036625 [Brachionus plicatilis]|uniref:Uncharacterized protein n=1 Tax=Brachionus plicatilis TaxID=10195 RepID=A0A3M7RT09_BRAPC|nr:hypothetical protein BpHYR1_036625 [Brachionus plicatilis]
MHALKSRILKINAALGGKALRLKPRVYVRPCIKYPTYGIKACVAKRGYGKIKSFELILLLVKLLIIS